MAVFGLNNLTSSSSGSSNSWNYSNRENDDFALAITGDVVEMKQVQATKYGTNEPDFWENKDGSRSPKLNFCITIKSDILGEKDWVFNPYTKKTQQNPDGYSKSMMAIVNALTAAGFTGSNLAVDSLGGRNITVSTQEPPEGFSYGAGSPRPFALTINGMATNPFRGCIPFGETEQGKNWYASQKQGQPARQAQPAPAQVQQVMAQAQPQVMQPQMVQQPMMAQPQMMQPMPQQTVPGIYDEDIPF